MNSAHVKFVNAVVGIYLACALAGCVQCKTSVDSNPILVKDGDAVAFLGDSITANGANYGKYCRLVVQGLKAKGVRVEPVLAGVSGNTSEDMLARLETDVLQRDPDWVVLACGVNDVWHTDPSAKIGVFQPKPGMGVELEDYKQNVREIVSRCEAAGVRVLLTTITPIREDADTNLNIKAKGYNAFLLKLAEERSLPIARLNQAMFAEIAKGRRLTSDGVHPIAAGDRVMAKGILEAVGVTPADTLVMEKEWQSSTTVLILGDRQTTSGGRPGGWCQLLMDGMNSGREMVTYSTKATYRGEVTVADMLNRFQTTDAVDDRFVIIQAARGDAIKETPVAEYRQQVETLVAAVRAKGSTPVLVTIAVQENDPEGELSRSFHVYNAILREVATSETIPLADINQVMRERYAADPETRLVYDGERLNREGSVLMTKTILQAMDLGGRLTPALRQVWATHDFYAE